MRRVWVKLGLIALGLVLVVAVPVVRFVHESNVGRAEWERAHGEAAVRGKTPVEVIEMLGEPMSVERDPDTSAITRLYYAGPYWNYCVIEFDAGRAGKVTFWSK